MKKKRGGIEYLSSIMLISLTGLLILFCVEYRNIRMCQIKIKDSIDISALAAAVADIELFEQEGEISLNEVVSTRMRFEEYLKYNLKLNDNMVPDNNKIYDKILIQKFIVYHLVNDEYIVRYDIDSDCQYVTQYMEQNGNLKTPDGKIIQGETIYVEIGININGLFNEKSFQNISSCVDIVGFGTEGE